MRWLILMLTSVLLGACAGSIEPHPNPIGSPPSRDPAPADRAEPTAVAAATAPPPAGAPGFRADLPDLGAAPELNNQVWLNTDRPLRLAELRGKVVVIDMWTFG
jgi:hypothetical protein